MTEYQKNLLRMWDSLRTEYKGSHNCDGILCKQCPFNNVVCAEWSSDGGHANMLYNAEKAIEIVTQWAKEHPVKTKLDEDLIIAVRRIHAICKQNKTCDGCGFRETDDSGCILRRLTEDWEVTKCEQ